MQLFPNVDNGEFQESVAVSREVTQLGMKRGDSNTAYLTPVRANAVFTIPGTVSDLYFAVKADFNEASPALLLANDWTLSSGVWSSPITQDIEEIETLLDGAEYKDVYAEVTWTSSTTGIFSSKTIRFRIFNDVWKGVEAGIITYPPGFSAPLTLTEEIPADGTDNLILSGVTSPLLMNGPWVPGSVVNSKQSYTIDGALETTDVVWTGTEWRIRRNFIVEGLTTLFSSTQNVATPDLVTAWTAGDGTGTPVFTPDTGTEATSLGQACIVTHSDASNSEWVCVSLSPFKWIPRGAGIFWNDDSSNWSRVTFVSSVLGKETLPDQ